jgi:hypothetical protein
MSTFCPRGQVPSNGDGAFCHNRILRVCMLVIKYRKCKPTAIMREYYPVVCTLAVYGV